MLTLKNVVVGIIDTYHFMMVKKQYKNIYYR